MTVETMLEIDNILRFLSIRPEHRAIQIEMQVIKGITKYLYPDWMSRILAFVGIKKPEGLHRANFLQNHLKANIAREASPDLLKTLMENQPFAFYLRPFRVEDVLSDPAWELSADGLRFERSVELSTVRRFGRIPVYGFFNALNVVDGGYRPVFVQSNRDVDWQVPLLTLCALAKVVVIDGTGRGPGLEWELCHVPKHFSEKTWLIAGQEPSGNWVSAVVSHAVDCLAPDHVTVAQVDDGVSYGGEIPDWVMVLLSSTESNV